VSEGKFMAYFATI